MPNIKPLCLCLAILGLLSFSSAQQSPENDPWRDWKFLLGEWTVGQGGGIPGQATSGSFSLSPELGGKILLRKNHSEYAAAGKSPVIHDDLMVIYQEAGATKAFYDDSEGHVIHYQVSVSADKKRIVFLSEPAQAQPRFRLTYENLGPGSVSVIFEIAPPDKPEQFSKYVEGTVHRKEASR
jgi:hypothetical protein